MKMKTCNKCDMVLPATEKYFYRDDYVRKDGTRNLESRCKRCMLERNKKYKKTESGKKARERYNKSEKGRMCYRKANKKYYYDGNGKLKTIQYQQSEDGKISHNNANRKYRKTKKGKKTNRKSLAKRRQNLGYIELYPNPFDESEVVDWHHIDDEHVVALPVDLHHLYGGYVEKHRHMCLIIVKQIYGDKICH